MKEINSLRDMYNSDDYQMFESDRLGNGLFISDPDRAERMAEHAEYGSNGSTHSEVIEDWRSYLKNLKIFDPEYDDIEDIDQYDINLKTFNKIEKEINECEEWHINNGSINTILS